MGKPFEPRSSNCMDFNFFVVIDDIILLLNNIIYFVLKNKCVSIIKMERNFGKRTKAFKDGMKFIVDDDFQYIDGFSFRLHKGEYVQFSGAKDGLCNKFLHRIIMDAPDHLQVDHINGDPLDNRKENLRLCSHQENQRNKGKYSTNTSGFKGVCWHKQNSKWKAQIQDVDGKSKHLGYFEDKLKAFQAYCEACTKYHGDFKHF